MKQKTYDATFAILGYFAVIAGHYHFIHKPHLQSIMDKHNEWMRDYKSNKRL
jgi:hypothetical protein